MQRPLRVPLSPLTAGEVTLSEAAARYVGRVHRLKDGDRLVVFDPETRLEAEAELRTAGKTFRCLVGSPRPSSAVAKTGITLLQALGKGDKPDQVIRDATALGADRILLVETSRSVVQLDADRRGARQRRFRTIAVESARQCGRGDVPQIEGPFDWTSAVAALSDVERRYFLSPGAPVSLVDALGERAVTETLALFVGPEGGFAASEEAAALEIGFIPVCLGSFVLRTETAAIAALSVAVLRSCASWKGLWSKAHEHRARSSPRCQARPRRP